jgi:hypothetical protein
MTALTRGTAMKLTDYQLRELVKRYLYGEFGENDVRHEVMPLMTVASHNADSQLVEECVAVILVVQKLDEDEQRVAFLHMLEEA